MEKDYELEIYKQYRTAQDKYTYFMLAAAGAAIALSINQTQSAILSVTQTPLALAVLLWGLSFYFGCRHVAWSTSALYSNIELLKVERGGHSLIGNDVQLMEIASNAVRTGLDKQSARAERSARLQFTTFVLGAVCYIGWHAFEMWLRTPGFLK